MNLAELAAQIRMTPRPRTQRERFLAWQKRNRAACTAYKRAWRAKRREQYGSTT